LGWAEPTSSRARLTSQRKKETKEHAHGIEMKESYQYTIVAFVTSLGVTPFNTTYDRAKMEKKCSNKNPNTRCHL